MAREDASSHSNEAVLIGGQPDPERRGVFKRFKYLEYPVILQPSEAPRLPSNPHGHWRARKAGLYIYLFNSTYI